MLKNIHDLNIIHNDIKPDNILIHNDKYYLCDFGLSSKDKKKINLVDIKIDPLYTAPEIYQGFSNKSSDIYSLGVTLYYLATGENVFDLSRDDSLAYTMLAHCKLNLDFTKIQSKKIQYLIYRMMDKNHRQRASISELQYILINDYCDFNLIQEPLDYSEEKNRSSVEIYEELSKDDISFAQNNLAIIYTTNNALIAFEYFQKAAKNGLLKAYYNLALCYKDGIGCEKDLEKSFNYFKLSSVEGDGNSLFLLALFYECGVYVSKDLTKAYALYAQSAYHGNKKAYKKLNSDLFLSENKNKLNYNSTS